MARGTFGERLKRERELREVTLQEITSATRISTRFLEALENEDWEKLPGGVFNRGFVRSIARYLGLDEEALLAEYDVAHPPQRPSNNHPEEKILAPPKWPLVVFVIGTLVLLAGLIAGGVHAWRHFASRHRVKQSSAPNSNNPAQPISRVPVSASSQSVAPAATSPLDLLVSTSAPTHFRVEADGNLVFDNDLRAGENRHFTAREAFDVTSADSGAVLLELNGQAMPPLGVPGSSGTMKLGRKDLR